MNTSIKVNKWAWLIRDEDLLCDQAVRLARGVNRSELTAIRREIAPSKWRTERHQLVWLKRI